MDIDQFLTYLSSHDTTKDMAAVLASTCWRERVVSAAGAKG